MRFTDQLKDVDYQWLESTNRLYKLEQYQDPYDQLYSEALGTRYDLLYGTHELDKVEVKEFKLSTFLSQLFKKRAKH